MDISATSKASPQSRSQPSRKGKRAWRKNVDITEVQAGLEDAREQIAATGGQLLADVPADALFQLDTAGSSQIKSQVRKAHPQLKADEIIAQRSAVPAVSSRKRPGPNDVASRVTDGVLQPSSKRRRGNGVSHKELQRLKGIAYGGASIHKDMISSHGTATYDPWAVSVPEPPKLTENFLPEPEVHREPKTLKRAPVSLTASGKPLPHVRKPLAGRSYNPNFEDWASLLTQEGGKELAAETKRRAEAAAEAEKQARIAQAKEEAEREEQREAMSEYDESEWEGIQSEIDEAQLKKKRPERKTPAERNKINRRKAAERLARHEKRVREREEQIKLLAAIKKELNAKAGGGKARTAGVVAKFPGSVESDASDAEGEEEQGEVLRRRRLGKHHIPEAPLEVVLADELQDSLRRLKPEGNLLKERFRNLLVQGKIEARKPIQQAKTKKGKVTEKWSSKDFKLSDYR